MGSSKKQCFSLCWSTRHLSRKRLTQGWAIQHHAKIHPIGHDVLLPSGRGRKMVEAVAQSLKPTVSLLQQWIPYFSGGEMGLDRHWCRVPRETLTKNSRRKRETVTKQPGWKRGSSPKRRANLGEAGEPGCLNGVGNCQTMICWMTNFCFGECSKHVFFFFFPQQHKRAMGVFSPE